MNTKYQAAAAAVPTATRAARRLHTGPAAGSYFVFSSKSIFDGFCFVVVFILFYPTLLCFVAESCIAIIGSLMPSRTSIGRVGGLLFFQFRGLITSMKERHAIACDFMKHIQLQSNKLRLTCVDFPICMFCCFFRNHFGTDQHELVLCHETRS